VYKAKPGFPIHGKFEQNAHFYPHNEYLPVVPPTGQVFVQDPYIVEPGYGPTPIIGYNDIFGPEFDARYQNGYKK